VIRKNNRLVPGKQDIEILITQAVGVLALRTLERGHPRDAAYYALIAVVLPPPNLVMLLAGGLLYFTRREPVAMAAA
jgi:hypothetical protein